MKNLHVIVKSRVCTDCGERKSAEHYHKNAKEKDGLYYCCKPCRAIRRRVKTYNLEESKYQEMVKATPHCPICGSEEPLVVDHDHSTGKVRGLICQPCNKGLGFFRDNTEAMKNAINYLEQ